MSRGPKPETLNPKPRELLAGLASEARECRTERVAIGVPLSWASGLRALSSPAINNRILIRAPFFGLVIL